MRYEHVDPRDRQALDETLRGVLVVAGLDEREEPTVIGVTSPGDGEGKTSVAIALAHVLAADFQGRDVLLVDGHLEAPGVARELGIHEGRGFSDVLRGDLLVEQAEHRLVTNGMAVLTAGSGRLDAGRAVRSERLFELFGRIRLMHRFTVVDLPPVLRSMATPVLARRCDAVVVVARHGQTTAADIGRSLGLLKDSPVAGVLLNRHRSAIPAFVRRAVGLAG